MTSLIERFYNFSEHPTLLFVTKPLKHMLTLDILKNLPKGIFASGIGLITHPEPYLVKKISEGGVLEEDGIHVKAKWVAVRGIVADWTIYHSLSSNFILAGGYDFRTYQGHIYLDQDTVAAMGQKLYDYEDIKQLVPCDEAAFERYRF